MKKLGLIFAILMILILSVSSFVFADIIPTSINVGVSSVILSNGEHIGEYWFMGPGWLIPLFDDVIMLPSVQFEFAPNLGNWGFVCLSTLEYPATKKIGLDFITTLAHDEDPVIGITGYLGVGFGIAYYVRENISIAPSVSYFWGASGQGESIIPGISFSLPLE